MSRKTLFLSLFFTFQVFICFSQGYPQVTIDPWTTKSGKKSTYYKILDWDTSPYKEFTFLKKSGPEDSDIIEYTNFRMLFPQGYDQLNESKKYPMIIFLHGAGESGVAWSGHFDYVNGYQDTPPEPEKIDNNDHQLLYGGQEFIAARNRNPKDSRAFPGFFLFPQIPYNGSWAGVFREPVSSYNRQVIELVELLLSKYKIDPDRIYVLGISNGARGGWDLINRRPDLFAAGVLMSGLGDRELMAEPLAHFPIWIFQGEEDTNPAPSGTYQIVNAIEEKGGTPRLTVYENLGHGIWNKAFKEPDFFSWLLSKTKLSIHAFYGKTHFKTLDSVKVKLGISPGFDNYQWKHNGEVINDSNNNYFMATKPGAYQVRLQRKEEWSSWSEPIFITSDEKEKSDPSTITYRINVGGPLIPDEPIIWEADNDTNPSPYLNENNEGIFQQNRFSEQNLTGVPNAIFESGRSAENIDKHLYYSFPFQGKAEVILYFVEPSPLESERAFDIMIEGEVVTGNLNLKEEAGYTATKRTYQTTVTDGSLDLVIRSVKGKPVLSGIEVKGRASITGIKENEDINQMIVYPNPFTHLLKITLSNNTSKVESITLRDLNGKALIQETIEFDSKEILFYPNALQLPPGMYFLEINFINNISQTLKILKQ